MLRQGRDLLTHGVITEMCWLVDMDHAIEEGPEEEVGEHLPKEPIGEKSLSGAKVFLPRATSLWISGLSGCHCVYPSKLWQWAYTFQSTSNQRVTTDIP